MKNIKYIIYILSSFLVMSCGENFFDSIVEVEVPTHDSNLAITAHLTNLDEVSLVHVTHTVGILDNTNAAPITDAKVELYGDGQLVQTYEYRELFQTIGGNGQAVTRDIYVVEESQPLAINTNYELRVSSPTYGEVTASQMLVNPTKIISGTYEEDGISGIFGEETTVDTVGNETTERAEEIAIKFQDRAGEKNYYAVEAIGFYDNEMPIGPEEYGEKFYLTPVDPTTEEGLSTLIFSDAAFDGKEYEFKMAAFFVQTERLKRIEVVLYTITEDRYLYETTLLNYEENDGNPFAEPVIIHENVSQGNGIFTVSGADVFTIEIFHFFPFHRLSSMEISPPLSNSSDSRYTYI